MSEPTETDLVIKVPQSEWYRLTLACRHEVYSRVKLRYEKPHRQIHKVRCPQCKNVPTAWQALTNYEAVTNEHVSNVHSGTAFILPNRIMRLDPRGTNGNLFPYTTKDREY